MLIWIPRSASSYCLKLGSSGCCPKCSQNPWSLNTGFLLHIGEPGLDELMSVVLSILQSTSPSFLLYASLDAGRRQMALEGYKLWQRALEMSQMARESINRIRGLRCLDEEVLDKPGAHWWDPTKLLIRVDGIGMSGSEAERHLRQAGVQVELAGLNHILVLITIGDGPKEVDRLLQALRELGTARNHDGKKRLQPYPRHHHQGKWCCRPDRRH